MLGGGSRGAALVLASLLALAAAPACSNGDDEDDRAAEAPAEPLPRLRAVRGERPRSSTSSGARWSCGSSTSTR